MDCCRASRRDARPHLLESLARREGVGVFWRFSLDLYQRKGVAPALLALQKRRGADVNLLLYCCWIALSGRGRLDGSDLRRAEAAIAPWREAVTVPLRETRDRIKVNNDHWRLDRAEEVRSRVLGAELASEQVTQEVLERMAGEPDTCEGTREDALASLLACFETLLGVEPDEDDHAHIDTLLTHAFDG